ncbi:MAG TPA: hypothetical protein ENN97_03245 [Phycisphaerales bacterium]|nr:hypothetical protein [Phycisphaerales bacterium]
MKHAVVLGIVAAMMLITGCENPELKTCRQDNQLLEAQTASLRQELAQARTTIQQKEDQIEKIKTENVEMQQKAMESIMSMLKKEEDRAKRLQTALTEKEQALKAEQDKTAELERTVSQSQQQTEKLKTDLAAAARTIETLRADLNKANQTIETLKSQAEPTQ